MELPTTFPIIAISESEFNILSRIKYLMSLDVIGPEEHSELMGLLDGPEGIDWLQDAFCDFEEAE